MTIGHNRWSLSHGEFFLISWELRYISRDSDHWSLSLVILAQKPILVLKTHDSAPIQPIHFPTSSHPNLLPSVVSFSILSSSSFISFHMETLDAFNAMVRVFCSHNHHLMCMMVEPTLGLSRKEATI